MAVLKVFLLGSLELRCGADLLPNPSTQKSQSLLAYLVTQRGACHSRHKLMGLFWGDSDEQRARRSLNTALWHIRRTLAGGAGEGIDPILSEGSAVRLNPAMQCWLDVEEFCRLAQGDVDLASAAVDLYRGDFLEGFYDDWVIDERYRLETLLLETLAWLMEAQHARGDHQAALAHAQRLLHHDPLREDGYRQAMRSYLSLGKPDAARQQYLRCQAVLRKEMGVEPAPETKALCQGLLDGQIVIEEDRAPPHTGRAAFDPRETLLVGREQELNLLLGHWTGCQQGCGKLILVSGEAGVGKTRLAQALADNVRWRDGGVLWGHCYQHDHALPYQPLVEALRSLLPNLTSSELDALPDPWLAEVASLIPELRDRWPGIPTAPPLKSAHTQARLFDALAGWLLTLAPRTQRSATLLVLEDLHWASESTLLFLYYLTRQLAAAPLMVLGTCRPEEVDPEHCLNDLRRRLGREGMVVPLPLQRLSLPAVRELLHGMSCLGEAIDPLAQRLYRETQGNPFFLTEIIRTLFEENRLRLGGGVWRGDHDWLASESMLPLSTNVLALIAARVARLSDTAREVLALAAVAGQEFDFAVLRTAWDQDEEITLQALEELLRRQLIEESAGGSEHDYRFNHHLIREVVYRRLHGQRRRCFHRRIGQSLEGLRPQPVEAMAYHFLQGEVWDKAIACNRQAGDRARAVYAAAEAIDFYGRALEVWERRQPDDDRLGIDLYLARGECCQDNGFFDQAEADLGKALRLAIACQQREGQARVLNRLSHLHYQRGDPEGAVSYAGEALGLAQAAGLPAQVAASLSNKADARWRQGRYSRAIELFEQAARLFHELGDLARLANCLDRQGVCLTHLGRHTQAQQAIEAGLTIRRRLDDKPALCTSINNLAVLLYLQGQFVQAGERFQEALDLAIAVGNRWIQGYYIFNVGTARLELGQPTQALSLFQQAVQMAQDMGDRSLETAIWTDMGRAHLSLGELARARESLEAALRLVAASGERQHEPLPHAYLAQVLLAMDHSELAWRHACAGWQAAQEIGDVGMMGVTLRILAEAHFQQDGSDPMPQFEQSIHLLREIGAQAELARSLAAAGMHWQRCDGANPTSRGLALLQEAGALFRQLGMAGDLARLDGVAALPDESTCTS